MAPTITSERKSKPRRYIKIPAEVRARAFDRGEEVRQSLKVLVSSRISRTNIAAELGVSRRQLFEWEQGRYSPHNLDIAYTIIEWAESVQATRRYLDFWREAEARGLLKHKGENNGK